MRRRNLLGGDSANYVFSAQKTSTNVAATSGSTNIYITSTKNGENQTYTYSGKTGSVVSSVTVYSTYITVKYYRNDYSYSRSSTIVLKQDGSNNIINIVISQNANAVSSSDTTKSVKSRSVNSFQVTSGPSWSTSTDCGITISHLKFNYTVNYSVSVVDVTTTYYTNGTSSNSSGSPYTEQGSYNGRANAASNLADYLANSVNDSVMLSISGGTLLRMHVNGSGTSNGVVPNTGYCGIYNFTNVNFSSFTIKDNSNTQLYSYSVNRTNFEFNQWAYGPGE